MGLINEDTRRLDYGYVVLSYDTGNVYRYP